MTVKPQFYEREFNGQMKDFVRISVTGNRDIFEAPVRPEDLSRFPEEWENYKKSKGHKKKKGSPLTDIPGMSEPRRVELELAEIETVEDLALAEMEKLLGLGQPYVELQKIAKLSMSAKKQETKLLNLSVTNESTNNMSSSQ